MYRPIKLFENDCSFILMKNRREEWGEIPNEFVKSIVYATGTPAVMTIEIPSKINYMNKEIDFDLYSAVRGKMQIIMNLNGELSRFIIDDKIKVKNTKKISTKTLTAYSFEKTLEKKNFIIPEGATRQLYRPADEKVEVSDGILNWFEEQTNFTVAHVDEMARKELGIYSSTISIDLFKNYIIERVSKGGLLWEKEDTIDIGDKLLNFTISYPNMESYNGELLQKRETITHRFANIPYAIKKIEARYSSDEDYRFGLTYKLTYKNNTTEEFKFGFANLNELRVVFPIIELTYETGEMSEKLTTKYRYFDSNSCSWTTMIGLIEDAFDCVCVFDSYDQTINVYDKGTFGEETGIVLAYDNAIKEITKDHKIGDIVTRLYVESPNVSISEENPLGTEYVENFDYYIENKIMSTSLTNALIKYNKLVDDKNIEFMKLKLEKNTIDQLITKRQGELSSLQGRFKAENAILTGYIKSGTEQAKQEEQSNLVTQIEKEIQQMHQTIQGLKDQSDSLFAKMTQIGIDIKKENAMENGKVIFNIDDLDELEDYLIESSITNDYYTLAYSLYQHAQEVIRDMNKVYIDFAITTYEFLSKIITNGAWNNSIKLGCKLELEKEHSDLADDEGLLQLYGFTLKPNEGIGMSITDLKFTNNKEPKETAIKTIGDISKKTNQLTTMTNFWKGTWEDSANNNVAVGNIIKNGLDAAAQSIRGKGSTNKIDISESGIYITDANDENKQIYYGSGCISITDDKWRTSKLAIDSSGIIANTLIGELVLAKEMQIGNAEGTFKIEPHGLTIYDPKAKNEERIFLGIDQDRALFRLRSKDNNNQLVLSEKGIYQLFPVQARDSFDYQNSFRMNFYLPESLQELYNAKMIFNLEHFRTYSKAAKVKETEIVSYTTSTAGGQTRTAKWYGGETKTVTSRTSARKVSTVTSTSAGERSDVFTSWNEGGTTTTSTSSSTGGVRLTTTKPNGSANGDPGNIHMGTHTHGLTTTQHSHTVRVTVPNHTHRMTVKVPSHSHNIQLEIPSHSHDVSYSIPSHTHEVDITSHSHSSDITIPGHSHDIIHGIYDFKYKAKCQIYIDGVLALDDVWGDREFDIAPFLRKPYGGTHTLEIKSKPTDSNPEGLGRANISLFIGGFVSY